MPAVDFRINPSCHRPSLEIFGLAGTLGTFSHILGLDALENNTALMRSS